MIVIIGENRTFDHVFATYQPVAGQHVDNLLSKGIVNADGTPGPNFSRGTQYSAVDSNPAATSPPLADPLAAGWQSSPGDKTAYTTLPPPGVGGPSKPFISSIAEAGQVENGLEPSDLVLPTTGGTGITGTHVADTRIPLVNSLPPGPFQLTPGVPYDAYAASPVHRFYEPGHYFLLNNYAPGYFGDGTVNTGAANAFTVPPLPASLPGSCRRCRSSSRAPRGHCDLRDLR